VWVTEIGSGESLNLSHGRFKPLYIEELRTLGFADDDSHLWVRTDTSSPTHPLEEGTFVVPTLGGNPRPFPVPNVAEVDWSPDRARTVFHPAAAGDPFFVADRSGFNPQKICGEKAGVHEHYPRWSPDGKWVAVVAGEGEEAQPLFRVPTDGRPPERLVDGVAYAPVWSPDGRFIAYAEGHQGRTLQLKAVTPDRHPFPLPALSVSRNQTLFRSTPDGKALVVMRGEHRGQNFWRLDLASGKLSQLTDFRPGYETRGFDISPDGRKILFDRYRENSDIVLIELPPR
jgi:Tol biopolymer transport system component